MNYNIEIFDVRGNIPSLTFFHSFYKKNKWKQFWDLINFKREKYPSYFIIQNIDELRNRNQNLGNKIDDLIDIYNVKMKKNNSVLYDFHRKLSSDNLNSIFLDQPGQYGLRGDPELWEELTEYFNGKEFPNSEKEFVELIEIAIIELTGKSIQQEKDSFFVEKYYHGSGMSGGIVSCEFWLFKAIPILIGRFRKVKNFC